MYGIHIHFNCIITLSSKYWYPSLTLPMLLLSSLKPQGLSRQVFIIVFVIIDYIYKFINIVKVLKNI